MFCSNCGKELKENANFCDNCGMMVKPPADRSTADQPTAEQQAAEQQAADQPPADQPPADQPATDQQAADQQAAPVYTPRVVSPKRKPSGKTAAIIIGIVSAAVILVCLIALIVTSLIGAYRRSHFDAPNRYPGGYFDDYDDYDDFFDDYYDFFNDDHHDGYRGYYGNANPTPAPTQAPSSTAAPDAAPNPLPTDSSGRTYDDPNYQWPTGDGTYEFYAKSTIPKFESVTGKPCTDVDVEDDGSTYYEYDMDMDAYNQYIKAIEAAGYSQTEFDVQGKNSYARYDNGVQYLIIYLMNSENEIVIMA